MPRWHRPYQALERNSASRGDSIRNLMLATTVRTMMIDCNQADRYVKEGEGG